MGRSLPTFERQQNTGTAGTAASRSGTDGAMHQASGKSPWLLKLSLPQVVVMWSVLAGTLAMSFLFGMYAGREQGLSSALEEYRGQAVRIPVAQPLASSEDSQEVLAALDEINAASGTSAEVPSIPSSGPSAGSETAGQPEFDFSPESKLSLSEAQGVKATTEAKVPKVDPKDLEVFKQEIESAKSSQTKAVKPAAKTSKITLPPQTSAEKIEPVRQPIDTQRLAPLTIPKSGWYVQVAAARSHVQASKVYIKAEKAGLKMVLERAKVRGQDYYRVIIGPYPDREAAVTARAGIKAKGVSRAEPFLKRVR